MVSYRHTRTFQMYCLRLHVLYINALNVVWVWCLPKKCTHKKFIIQVRYTVFGHSLHNAKPSKYQKPMILCYMVQVHWLHRKCGGRLCITQLQWFVWIIYFLCVAQRCRHCRTAATCYLFSHWNWKNKIMNHQSLVSMKDTTAAVAGTTTANRNIEKKNTEHVIYMFFYLLSVLVIFFFRLFYSQFRHCFQTNSVYYSEHARHMEKL